MPERAELHDRVIEAFAARPEVYEIHAFGREVDGDTDEYSDLDLIVCSADLAATQREYRQLLNTISPIVGIYHIVCQEREHAQMIMLRDYRPYQKIDLSLTDTIETKRAFAPFKCLLRRRSPAATGSRLSFNGERDSLANQLNDLLFSIPRFTKCLFRRDRDMYRRWTGAVEQLAVLLYESCFGWTRQQRYRLQPQEYKAMHKRLDPADEARLDAIQPLDRSPDLAEGFRLAVAWVIELYQSKAAALNDQIDLALAERLREFLDGEVARFDLAARPAR